jgi:hypothetical protein
MDLVVSDRANVVRSVPDKPGHRGQATLASSIPISPQFHPDLATMARSDLGMDFGRGGVGGTTLLGASFLVSEWR